MGNFMQLETDYMTVFHVETKIGTELVLAELVGTDMPDAEDLEEYCEGEIQLDDEGKPDYTAETGWYCRESAPGYLDCTDWCGPYDTEVEAISEYCDMHEICETCLGQCWDTDTPCEPDEEAE